MRTAFITGCASGFGHALCRRLLGDGWRVVATDPHPQGITEALGASDRLLVRPLDVRDVRQVDAAVADALAWSAPDLVVNNGGYAIFGSQEEADLEAVRDLFDVNVLGVARVTQALLPTIRARAGTFVHISSVAGRMAFPESGFYAATKHSVEAMAEALAVETCTFGVRVRLIEPGSFATRFLDRARAVSQPRDTASPYSALHEVWDARKVGVLEEPQDPARVVDAIVTSLDDPRPFLRVPVGPDAARILGLREALSPDGWVQLMARSNGWEGPPGPGDVVRTPEQVVAGTVDAATLAALHHGHLLHWEDSVIGRRALAVLRAHAEAE